MRAHCAHTKKRRTEKFSSHTEYQQYIHTHTHTSSSNVPALLVFQSNRKCQFCLTSTFQFQILSLVLPFCSSRPCDNSQLGNFLLSMLNVFCLWFAIKLRFYVSNENLNYIFVCICVFVLLLYFCCLCVFVYYIKTKSQSCPTAAPHHKIRVIQFCVISFAWTQNYISRQMMPPIFLFLYNIISNVVLHYVMCMCVCECVCAPCIEQNIYHQSIYLCFCVGCDSMRVEITTFSLKFNQFYVGLVIQLEHFQHQCCQIESTTFANKTRAKRQSVLCTVQYNRKKGFSGFYLYMSLCMCLSKITESEHRKSNQYTFYRLQDCI